MPSARTIHRWWRRESFHMEVTTVAPPRFTHLMTRRQITRLEQRMRRAEADVREWVAELSGALDVGSGGVFDGRLDGLEVKWHAQDDREHNAYLSELGKRLAKAQGAIVFAEKTVEQSKEDQERAARDYEGARVRLGGEPRSRQGEPTGETEGNASQLEPLMWLFVLGAVAGDIAVFYNVLARLFRSNPVLVGACTVGFVAAAIGICHLIGIGLQERQSAVRSRSDALLWAKLVAWLALGCLAFFVRLRVGVSSSSTLQNMGSSGFGLTPATNVDRDLLAALFFAGLYLVSGLVAITASFRTFNPAARAFRHASRNFKKLKKAERNTKNAQAQLVEQIELKSVVDAEVARAAEQRRGVRYCTEANIVILKWFVRNLIAAELNDPTAHDILMKDAPKMKTYPEPEPAS